MNRYKNDDDRGGASSLTCVDPPKEVTSREDSNSARELDYEQTKQALKALLLDADLEKIDNRASTFNVFETLKLMNTELKHSIVLAWLCDPNENHGFDHLFIKGLLRQVIKKSNISPLDIFTLDNLGFDTIEVYRERDHIDVLIIVKDEKNNPVYIAIENKVGADESENQLKDYNSALEQIRKEENQENAPAVKIFLTPDNKDASDNSWITLCYSDIYAIITAILDFRGDQMDSDVASFIRQYQSTLRRYVMNEEDKELQELCKNIYRNHKKALELIYRNRPDLVVEIKKHLLQLIKELMQDSSYGIEIISESKGRGDIDFCTRMLTEKYGDESSHKNKRQYPKLFYRISFYYEVKPEKNNLDITLSLRIRDGEKYHKDLLSSFASYKKSELFKNAKNSVAKSVYTNKIVGGTVFPEDQADEEALLSKYLEKADESWNKFQNKHLKEIEDFISSI